jgi:hypothetical protein
LCRLRPQSPQDATTIQENGLTKAAEIGRKLTPPWERISGIAHISYPSDGTSPLAESWGFWAPLGQFPRKSPLTCAERYGGKTRDLEK